MSHLCECCGQPTRPGSPFCASHATAPLCPPFQHDYRGTATPGLWGCWRCGAVLPSQAIRVELAEVPKAPVMDVYC